MSKTWECVEGAQSCGDVIQQRRYVLSCGGEAAGETGWSWGLGESDRESGPKSPGSSSTETRGLLWVLAGHNSPTPFPGLQARPRA